MRTVHIGLLFLFLPVTSVAGEADIVDARVEAAGGDFYRFYVTVQHDDENWEHYAKAWEVLDTEGNLLGARILRHPHINEQPFARTLTVEIPADVDQVIIRAYDLVHKLGGQELTLKIDRTIKNDNQ